MNCFTLWRSSWWLMMMMPFLHEKPNISASVLCLLACLLSPQGSSPTHPDWLFSSPKCLITDHCPSNLVISLVHPLQPWQSANCYGSLGVNMTYPLASSSIHPVNGAHLQMERCCHAAETPNAWLVVQMLYEPILMNSTSPWIRIHQSLWNVYVGCHGKNKFRSQ